MNPPEPKPAGTWDFYGACAPQVFADGRVQRVQSETFTLGIFQWVPRARGKGTKPGLVQRRIRGRSDNPLRAFADARQFCDENNAETVTAEGAQP